jgi:hypothetical protein
MMVSLLFWSLLSGYGDMVIFGNIMALCFFITKLLLAELKKKIKIISFDLNITWYM